MEIKLIKSTGVPRAEIEAHQLIQREFHNTDFSNKWRAYASFALARPGHGSGDEDFDLVLITHANIIAIELKNWNGKLLESKGGKWYVDGEDRGNSHSKLINEKSRRLGSVMKQKLGLDKTLFVNAYVVLHGNLKKIEITSEEERSVLNLEQFLSFRFEHCYKEYFPGRPKFNPLVHIAAYDDFFQGPAFRPKTYYIDGFRPEGEAIFAHPKHLYNEYRAVAKDDSSIQALLRQWDFNAFGMELIGENGRDFIGLREQRIFDYVYERNEELSRSLLTPLSRKSSKDVTIDFTELYRLPPRVTRLTEFTHSELPKLSKEERLDLVKVLLSRFAELHDLKVAHRDVGDHSLWIDRPAKIVISGFLASYFPEMKTIGSFRDKVKVEQSEIPEAADDGKTSTPYHRDVFMIGVLSYLLIYGDRPPKVNGIYEWGGRADDIFDHILDSWLKKSLDRDPSKRFGGAREMLEDLNKLTANHEQSIIDYDLFDCFKADTKERDYDEIEVFEEDNDYICFKSDCNLGECTVKVWYGVEPDKQRPDFSLRLLTFLERARAIKGFGISGFPDVIDFGLSKRSLIIVYSWVHGVTLTKWLESKPELDSRISVAAILVDILDRLHDLDMAHGDIHPDNIIIKEDNTPIFIDILDFHLTSSDAYTTAYLPENYKSLSPSERDRYGLAAVLIEMFGATRSEPKNGAFKIPRIYDELSRLLSGESLSSLAPLIKSIELTIKNINKDEIPDFTLLIKNLSYYGFPSGELRSDNNHFYISVQKDRGSQDVYRFWVTGIGWQFSFGWNLTAKTLTNLNLKKIPQSELIRRQMMSDIKIPLRLNLIDAPAHNIYEFVEFILSCEAITTKLPLILTEQPDELSDPEETEVVDAPADKEVKLSVSELWRELLEAEEDSFRTITIAGEKRDNEYRNGQILIPYHLDTGVIDYDRSDNVIVENQISDGVWKPCGTLNLRDTTFGQSAELAIDNPYLRAGFYIGNKLRLVSTLEKGSFTRRRFAVDRILDRKSVVPDLIGLFNNSATDAIEPITYQCPTDEDLDVYTQKDKRLNPSQRDAFKKVICNGPISLLQGPPGTGKTYFIATILHYLITKERARRILLVSQAHEAVNNALEKALGIFQSQGISFDAVRLGSESATSPPIRHLHAMSIEQSYRERFKAEQKERIIQLAPSLGLPKTFVSDFVELHLRLGAIVKQISRIDEKINYSGDSPEPGLEHKKKSLVETFFHIARDVYGIDHIQNPSDAMQEIELTFIKEHEINSIDAISRLKKLILLSNEWLTTLGAPEGYFTEFLAKSRTIVAGTCVGIGYRGAGVVQNVYDWVIIDEAGRAAPSELAVAMQAGRRILLVGDHHQLPPTFSDEVRTIIKKRLGVNDISKVFASDFERIFDSEYGKQVGTTLLSQYRMAPVIGEIVSSCFYNDQLVAERSNSPEYYDVLPDYLSKQVTWIDTSSLGEKAYHQVSSDKKDKWNEIEAIAILKIAKDILESDVFMSYLVDDLTPQEPAIGIICMYSKQRERIDKLKAEATWLGDAKKYIKVDTVDSYQGKENRIVILSTVRNNKEKTPGFLDSPNRINVAMSRAMERLIIIGSSQMWKGKNISLPLGKVFAKVEQLESDGKAAVISAAQFVRQ